MARSNYHSIMIGDMDSGEGGSTIDDVIVILGEPTSSTEDTPGDSNMVMDTWDEITFGDMAFYAVTFIDGRAITKGYSGFGIMEGANTVTQDDFNAISVEDTFTYDEAIKQFGYPAAESEARMMESPPLLQPGKTSGEIKERTSILPSLRDLPLKKNSMA
ncbi:MAG: DUF3862 domain-containing protein [Erysipelotrichia bacterium]|nr:DUF3862 domain-containing protein [Erysipelotrichia bacterium]